MRAFWLVAMLNVGAVLAGTPASACFTVARMDLHDVEYADVVVVGRVANYEIVRDPVARQRYQDMLARIPQLRETPRRDDGFLSDYARFDILVDEVLRGEVPQKIAVTWDHSTFGEPQSMQPGPYLIALRKPSSQMPPLRGPSATILLNPPAALTVLEAPCAGPFMFEKTSESAALVRQILASAPSK